MRLRITTRLSGSVDGVDLSRYVEGLAYNVSSMLGSYLLAEGWAVPIEEDAEKDTTAARFVTSPSVLIVEDDADTRLILSQLLEYHGWTPHTAADGIAGLAALEHHRPALILLDLAMPRMDGVAFRTAQRQLADRRLANVPVVVVSAVHDAPKFRSILNAADVLVKPFEPDLLLAAVESHMRPATVFRW